jgi:peptidoglycan hydrolase-like protein with peptidoglycan-binding domain
MGKVFVYILTGSVVFIMFFAPARNYMNNLFRRDKNEKLKANGEREEQIIGDVSGYNPRVEEIQGILKEAGFEPGQADGMLGAKTREAIKGFQKKKGLKPTGKIDSLTQLALGQLKETEESIHTQAPGSTDRPRQIQEALKNSGFYKGGIDGKIGPATKSAIRSFQKANKLNVDGVVGEKTWEELKKYLDVVR